MKVEPEIVDMIAKVAAVNAVAVLLLAVMSYVLSALMLNGLATLEKWLDPSLKPGSATSTCKRRSRSTTIKFYPPQQGG